MNKLAIDIGGSAIKYALIDDTRNMLVKDKIPNPRSMDLFISVIADLYEQYKEQIDGIGISVAGKCDPKDGTVVSAGNFPYLTGKSLVELLKPYCPVKITVDNDAHCAAFAEMQFGSLVNVQNAIAIILGTGIGGALILDGKIYSGSRFCSAEFSLIRINGEVGLDNSWVHCGGARGLIKMVKEALGTDEELDGVRIFEMLEQKNPVVHEVMDKYCRIAAVQIYNFQALLDVDVVAIGGGISAQPILTEMIEKHLREIIEAEAKYKFPVSMPKLVRCKYGNDANLFGAWYDNCTRELNDMYSTIGG